MINIRLAAQTDAECIAKLHTNSWGFTYSDIVPRDILDKYTSRFSLMWCKMLEKNLPARHFYEKNRVCVRQQNQAERTW